MSRSKAMAHLAFDGESAQIAGELQCYMEAWSDEHETIICYQGTLTALVACARIMKHTSFQIIRPSDNVTLVCGYDGVPKYQYSV